jgi:hypothetical protein
MELRCSSEFSRNVLAPVSVRCSPRALSSSDYRVFTRSGSRDGSRAIAGPSLELPALLQSTPGVERPPARLRCARLRSVGAFPGVLFPSSVYPPGAAVCVDRVCLARSRAPSGFLDPLTPSSAPSLLALFHARSALGVSPFRAFLLPCSRSPSPAPLPSCRWKRPSCRPALPTSARKRAFARHVFDRPGAPRLQGFAPHESPPLRSGCLGRPGRVALLGLVPSRVFSLSSLDRTFTRSPLTSLRARPQATSHRLPRVSLAGEIGLSLSRLPTLLGFLAS